MFGKEKSHLKFRPTVLVVGKLFSGEVTPLFRDKILKEYNEVLHRTKLHFSEETVVMLIQTIEKLGERIVPLPTGDLLSDMKDLPFYEAVVEKQEDDAYLQIHYQNQGYAVITMTGSRNNFPSITYILWKPTSKPPPIFEKEYI